MSSSSTAFPPSLAWVERGSALIRRMNSERIAEDPRLRRLLLGAPPLPSPSPDSAQELHEQGRGQQAQPLLEEPATASTTEEAMATAGSSTEDDQDSNASTQRESFEQVEAATDDEERKQENDNAAPNTYRVLLWTYRVHASLAGALQYAVFAKASDDGYFVPIAPRLFCVAPAYLTTFTKLFEAHTSTRQWNAAVKLLTQLDAIIGKRYETGACVFDCGLFDGIKRLHHKPLVYDEFCDGRVASIQYCRGPIPSMHSAFVVASTAAAWLDLNPSNVAILVAPNNEQISVFATCCTVYSTDATTFPPNFSRELLEVYQRHIRGSESWPTKLSRTFSGLDAKNVYYTGGNVPKPQARFVADFTKLLEMRDTLLTECADAPDVIERKQKLTGVTVTPAAQTLYVHEICLRQCVDANSGVDEQATSPTTLMYRPYFVLQNDKGVLFSSMIHGVRDVNVSSGVHTFRVAKTINNCSEFSIKMYHLPFGRQGELMLESRVHSALLLDSIGRRVGAEDTGEVTLSTANGDFDCISSFHTLPKGFVLVVRYARASSAFPAAAAVSTSHDTSHASGESQAAAAPTSATSLPPRAPTSRNSFVGSVIPSTDQPKPVRYDGPPIVQFLLDQRNVRTAFGDVTLQKIDVIRRVSRGHLDIYLLFTVDLGGGVMKVLPYGYLFRYILPDPVRAKMLAMGATEESLNASAPSSFDVGTGMTFDEEYARWLQHIYDTDLNNSLGTFDGEVASSTPVVEAQPGLSYRCVSLSVHATVEMNTPPPAPVRAGRQHPRIRGAATSLIQQLPTYIYGGHKDQSGGSAAHAIPDCLVCRCEFEAGEEIKSLPCFHSYHTDCIDSWLTLNKVCPVCQFPIDHGHAAASTQQ